MIRATDDFCCCFCRMQGPTQTHPANAWQKTQSSINDPKNVGFGDVTYWVVEGDVGPVATFVKVGGANIQARRVGAPAPNCTAE